MFSLYLLGFSSFSALESLCQVLLLVFVCLFVFRDGLMIFLRGRQMGTMDILEKRLKQRKRIAVLLLKSSSLQGPPEPDCVAWCLVALNRFFPMDLFSHPLNPCRCSANTTCPSKAFQSLAMSWLLQNHYSTSYYALKMFTIIIVSKLLVGFLRDLTPTLPVDSHILNFVARFFS